MIAAIFLLFSFSLYAQQEFINDPYCGSDDAINIKSIKYPWYKQSAENVFYCGVKRCGYSVPCRFQPAAYHEIALYADIVEGRPVLIIGGEHFSIDQFDSKPKPL